MLLILLNNGRHEYSCFSSHSDEGMEIGFTDSPLVAEAVGDQIAVLDPATDCLIRDLQMLRDLRNSVEGSTGTFCLGSMLNTHGITLHHVGGETVPYRRNR